MDLGQLFLAERNIPYNIPLSCTQVDHCCSGKHERLMKAFKDAGVDCRYRVCWFRWSDLSLPAEVASISHENDCTHVYLEINVDDRWLVVDATWDPGLVRFFPINNWVPDQDMIVAVPVTKTLSPSESADYMSKITTHDIEADLEKHREFYQAFNNWLSQVRSESIK